VQTPVLDFVLWPQSYDTGNAMDAAISSLGGTLAGVCCVHRTIVASGRDDHRHLDYWLCAAAESYLDHRQHEEDQA
jgi:hypothetical protein